MEQEQLNAAQRDHGGGLDSAIAKWGGTRASWIDLSTGINPVPYSLPQVEKSDWTALPDRNAQNALLIAARTFWNVPEQADILAAPGASSLIAALPTVIDGKSVHVPTPTYNEHAAAFEARAWNLVDHQSDADVQVLVHPNNPDGRLWDLSQPHANGLIIDESFGDTVPATSHIARTRGPNTIVLKSFGKFWGLAGLRLGFAIGCPSLIAQLCDAIGPWAVSGPALRIGAVALNDADWAAQTRSRLRLDSDLLDALMQRSGATLCGGTTLFRLYEVADAQDVQNRLAKHHIWSRIFPYSSRWIRLGHPPSQAWPRLEAAIQA
ncbi:MAG: threonine-phosphate decarboxylase [Paracoccaceae bacterium]